MNIKFSSFILLFLMTISCSTESKWKGRKEIKDGVVYIHNPVEGLWNDSRNMVFEKLFTIGDKEDDENYILATIRDMDVDDSGNIFICDETDHCIKVYDSDGKFIRRMGQKGQGPGEFNRPQFINLVNNKLVVFESANRRISILTQDGEYIKSFRPEFPSSEQSAISPAVWDMVHDSDGNIVLAIYIPYGDERIMSIKQFHTFDMNGNILHSFGDPVFIGKTNFGYQPPAPKMVQFAKKNIICSYSQTDEIRSFNSSGNLLKVIMKDKDEFQTKLYVKGPFQALMTQYSIIRPVSFPDNKLLIVLSDKGPDFLEDYIQYREKEITPENYEKKTSHYYDMFDDEGLFLQRFRVDPELGLIFHIDQKGYVYTMSEDEVPMIHKYRISFMSK